MLSGNVHCEERFKERKVNEQKYSRDRSSTAVTLFLTLHVVSICNETDWFENVHGESF